MLPKFNLLRLSFQLDTITKAGHDYVTLLMYAAQEDISFCIANYYQINIEKYKRISSNAGKVAFYLSREMKGHKITELVLSLHNNTDWRKCIEYRNKWVHEKPPIIEGLVNEFPRMAYRVSNESGRKNITIIGGTPLYSIDQFLGIAINAANALSVALSGIAEIIIQDNQA
jgi:hypothetical protein